MPVGAADIGQNAGVQMNVPMLERLNRRHVD
jgi:hypothetical protein